MSVSGGKIKWQIFETFKQDKKQSRSIVSTVCRFSDATHAFILQRYNNGRTENGGKFN